MAGLLHLQSTFLPSSASSPLRAAASTSCQRRPRQRRACRVEAKIREIFMPALSSTLTEGKIVSWAAAEGDRLAKGDPVVVVESDMDVETFHDGFLAAVLVPAGESAPVGSAIALLAESEDEIPLAQSQAASFSSAPQITSQPGQIHPHTHKNATTHPNQTSRASPGRLVAMPA